MVYVQNFTSSKTFLPFPCTRNDIFDFDNALAARRMSNNFFGTWQIFDLDLERLCF